jgi:hypothetical protein
LHIFARVTETYESIEYDQVLDLKTGVWDQLPANPRWSGPGASDRYFAFEDYFADPVSHMNLILPSSLWCQEGAVHRDQIRETSRDELEILDIL